MSKEWTNISLTKAIYQKVRAWHKHTGGLCQCPKYFCLTINLNELLYKTRESNIKYIQMGWIKRLAELWLWICTRQLPAEILFVLGKSQKYISRHTSRDKKTRYLEFGISGIDIEMVAMSFTWSGLSKPTCNFISGLASLVSLAIFLSSFMHPWFHFQRSSRFSQLQQGQKNPSCVILQMQWVYHGISICGPVPPLSGIQSEILNWPVYIHGGMQWIVNL